MKSLLQVGQQSKHRRKKSRVMKRAGVLTRRQYEALDLDSRAAVINELIPLGLMMAAELMDEEVEAVAGPWHSRKAPERRVYRNGMCDGSVMLGGQRVPIAVPRIRDERGEIRLQSYAALQEDEAHDESMFKQVLYGVSCRNYERAAVAAPGAIGLSKSTVSKRFVRASAEQLKAFQERPLDRLDLLALFLDGKTFADDQMVIALGVDLEGSKHVLGFVQTETENKRAITAFLRGLQDRGLDTSRGLLAIIDGAKGLRAAVRAAFGSQVLVQRCLFHKRENIVSYLPVQEQTSMRLRLQRAYDRPTYSEARQALLDIRRDLEDRNQSAMNSLDEGFEETLTLHRLGVFSVLGQSFKTTNCLESINAQAEERCAKVDRWKNAQHKCRWLAAALIDIEPRLKKVKSSKHLSKLRRALMIELGLAMEPAAIAA